MELTPKLSIAVGFRRCPQADQFRSKYHTTGELVVDILSIVEFDLGLEIIPVTGLRQNLEIEVMLRNDLGGLTVDAEHFNNSSFETRMRFSVAHEVGHLELHKEFYKKFAFATPQQWITLIGQIPEKKYGSIEIQANEFAGRVLVEPNALRREFNQAIEKVEPQEIDMAISYLSGPIGKKFHVSGQVIERRLRNEGIWPLR